MNLGTGPIFSIYGGQAGSFTISGSMLGTAAATQLISSATFTYARGMEVFNLTGRNLELIIGNDLGTAAYTTAFGVAYSAVGKQSLFFVPGTASATVAGRANRFACAFQQGFNLWVRTTENTPITCTSVLPLVINFWA